MDHLRTSRERLAADLGLGATLDSVVRQWSAPHRHYHVPAHLDAALRHAEVLYGGPLPVTVELALWYHDVVYDATRSDNERVSADQAAADLADVLTNDDIAEIERLIMLTATHEVDLMDRPGAVLVDADMSILGAPPGLYDAYAAAVRLEYGHLDDATFSAGRATFLHGAAEATRLFVTELGHELWDDPARANIDRELARLSRS